MNILFVCRYNRFRSRVAEALFGHYNKNKGIIVKSAGTGVDQPGFPMMSIAQRVLGKLEVSYDKDQGAQEINDYLLDWADRIYVVADDASTEGLPPEKTFKFNIPDSWVTEDETLGTVKQIEAVVKKLVKELT